jgi:hypothetical protein
MWSSGGRCSDVRLARRRAEGHLHREGHASRVDAGDVEVGHHLPIARNGSSPWDCDKRENGAGRKGLLQVGTWSGFYGDVRVVGTVETSTTGMRTRSTSGTTAAGLEPNNGSH